jgi:hypothetical protein
MGSKGQNGDFLENDLSYFDSISVIYKGHTVA